MFLLPKGSPLFENLAVSKLKLPDVLTKLSNGSFTGYASFVFQSSTASRVVEAGKLVSVLVEDQDCPVFHAKRRRADGDEPARSCKCSKTMGCLRIAS